MSVGRALSGRLLQRLFAPVDIASLVFFRIAFGVIMLSEVARYFAYGWIPAYWIEPSFHFTYLGFGWVRPWPGVGMYVHFLVLGILAGFITLGLFYRASSALFFLGFAYMFLLDQTRYLNHFYFVTLVSLLLIFVPAHRAFSLDARRRPALGSQTAPAWALWILRAQMGFVYFFGGVAKLNSDWLHGEPIRQLLAARRDYALVGRYLAEEWVVWVFAVGGLLFDLLVVPLLLWPRTRKLAFGVALLFHVTNGLVFGIGIFPWFAVAATLLFFSPSWPRRLAEKLPSALTRIWREPDPMPPVGSGVGRGARRAGGTAAILGIYAAIQALLPLRHWLYPGKVSWTEEGHNFSWHMMLRRKTATAEFSVTDPVSGKTWQVDPRHHLTPRQYRKMSTRPDMILCFSHHLADTMRTSGQPRVAVRARVMAALNGRKPQLLIDPAVDLAAQPRSLLPSSWIMPLVEPLPIGGPALSPGPAEE